MPGIKVEEIKSGPGEVKRHLEVTEQNFLREIMGHSDLITIPPYLKSYVRDHPEEADDAFTEVTAEASESTTRVIDDGRLDTGIYM